MFFISVTCVIMYNIFLVRLFLCVCVQFLFLDHLINLNHAFGTVHNPHNLPLPGRFCLIYITSVELKIFATELANQLLTSQLLTFSVMTKHSRLLRKCIKSNTRHLYLCLMEDIVIISSLKNVTVLNSLPFILILIFYFIKYFHFQIDCQKNQIEDCISIY